MKIHFRSMRAWLAIAMLLALGACATPMSETAGTQRQGPGSDFSAAEVKAYVESQDQVRAQLAFMAQAERPQIVGIARMPTDPLTEWDGLIDAGMNFADSKCRTYLDALYRLDRNRRTTVAQIGLVGTATAGLMAAAKSAAKEVAIVAILFGLSASTVENLAGNVLYELPPSTVASMVDGQHQAFRESLQRGYPNWPSALGVIQSYAVICVPSHIENEINIAVKKSKAGTTAGNPATGQPPAVSNALAVWSGDFGVDDISRLLLDFVNASEANRQQLQQYLNEKEGRVAVGALVSVGSNAPARRRAARAMQLIP